MLWGVGEETVVHQLKLAKKFDWAFLLLFCWLGHIAISGTYWLTDSLQSLLPALTCEILPERAKFIRAIEPFAIKNTIAWIKLNTIMKKQNKFAETLWKLVSTLIA